MQGTSLGLDDRPGPPPADEQHRPPRRAGRHRLVEPPARRRARRFAPPAVAALAVVVAVVAAAVGDGDAPDPQLDAALTGARPSAVTPTSAPPDTPQPSATPATSDTPAPTSAPASATSAAPTTSASQAPSRSRPPSTTAAPRSSPAPRSTRAPGTLTGGTVQWRGDFDPGDASQWDLETAEDYSLTVRDGGPGHPTAARFEVRDGDTPVDSGERSEAKPPDWTDVSEGDERWYAFSMMFDKSFPVPADGWCDPVQWHPANADHSAAEGSPPLNFQCGNNGDDRLYLQVGDRELLPVGMLDRGVWHRYLVHVRFSNDAGSGFQEVYRDGQLVLPRTSSRYANMSSAKLYLKVGMYRKGTNDGPMVVWHDDMAIYTSAPTIAR